MLTEGNRKVRNGAVYLRERSDRGDDYACFVERNVLCQREDAPFVLLYDVTVNL